MTKLNLLLVSQFHFVYWYNIVLVLLTRRASSGDVECIIFITGQILNGKQCSQSADKLSFIHNNFSLCLSKDDMNRLITKLCNSYLVLTSDTRHGVAYKNQTNMLLSIYITSSSAIAERPRCRVG